MVVKRIFVAGGTGYIGVRDPRLVQADYDVTLLARPGSAQKVPLGANVLIGDA